MKDLEINGVPYSLLTDGWWLVEDAELPPQTPRRPVARDLLVAALITAGLCLLPALSEEGDRTTTADLTFPGASLPR